MGRPTISDVAEKSGFSKATVSAVINNASTVSDSTRRKVEQVIDELNYRPRAAARNVFQAAENKSLGLVVKEGGNPYYVDVLNGARSYANEEGYTLLTASSEGKYASEQKIVDVFKGRDVDGLIVVPVLNSETDLSYLFELKRRNFPFVLLEEIQGIQASLVDIDNEAASKKVAQHLFEKGHQRLVHFAGPTYSMHSKERIWGIQNAFSESPLAFSHDLVVRAGATLRSGYETAVEYFDDVAADERPTAAICYNDLVAIGVMRALREAELHVPEDVAVVGCDDIDIAEYMETPLTSIQIPKFEMGRRAAKMLVEQVESKEETSPTKIRLEAELVKRATT